MGGGKGSSGSVPVNTTSTVNQSNLPDYAAPYFTNLLQQSQQLGNQPYQPYTGDRIAGLNQNQGQAIANVQNTQNSWLPSFDAANSAAQGATQVGLNAHFDPSQVNNTYNAGSWTNPGTQSQYMSPYQQGVTNIAMNEANRQFGIQGQQLNAQAAGHGAFGGYRDGIVQAEAQRNQNQLLNNIQTQGLQSAYTQGANQFNTEQGFGQAQSQMGMAATQANNQYGLGAQQLGLQGGQLALQGAQATAGIGQARQQANLADSQALMNAGSIQQNQAQTGLNTGYQDFLNQQYYGNQLLNWQSGILRGVPVSANQTVTGYTAPPSPVSQVAGLGLGAAGLSKMFAS